MREDVKQKHFRTLSVRPAFRGYEFNRQTRDVLNQNLEPQDVLCFPNECSDEVWNKGSQEGSPIRVSPKQSQPLQDVDRQGG